MSYLAEKRYLDRRTDRIKLNALWQDADPLPKRHRTFQSFKASFGCVNHYEFEIADCSIVVDVKYAFRHFNQIKTPTTKKEVISMARCSRPCTIRS